MNKKRSKGKSIVINHLENIYGICTKTGLVKSLKKLYKSGNSVRYKYDVFDTTPTTFLVLSNCNNNDYFAFVQRFQEISKEIYKRESMPSKHCTNNMWLIKPAADNQGKGIEVFKNDLLGMNKFLAIKPHNTYWICRSCSI